MEFYEEIGTEKQIGLIKVFEKRVGAIRLGRNLGVDSPLNFSRTLIPNDAAHIALVGQNIVLYDGGIPFPLGCEWNYYVNGRCVEVNDNQNNYFAFAIESEEE